MSRPSAKSLPTFLTHVIDGLCLYQEGEVVHHLLTNHRIERTKHRVAKEEHFPGISFLKNLSDSNGGEQGENDSKDSIAFEAPDAIFTYMQTGATDIVHHRKHSIQLITTSHTYLQFQENLARTTTCYTTKSIQMTVTVAYIPLMCKKCAELHVRTICAQSYRQLSERMTNQHLYKPSSQATEKIGLTQSPRS